MIPFEGFGRNSEQILVLDTNQVSALPSFNNFPSFPKQIVLSPFVIAEILLWEKHRFALEKLDQYSIFFGLEPQVLMEEISRRGEKELVEFVPYYGPHIRSFLSVWPSLSNVFCPTVDHFNWATRVKKSNQKYGTDFVGLSRELWEFVKTKKVLEKTRGKIPRLEYLLETEAKPGTFFFDMVIGAVSLGRQPAINDSKRLFAAILKNTFLRRYFSGLLYYLLAWAHLFQDNKQNFETTNNGNDFTDISLLLCCPHQGIVLSSERRIQKAFRYIDEDIKVIDTETLKKLLRLHRN